MKYLVGILVLTGCHNLTSPEYIKYQVKAKAECSKECEDAGSKLSGVSITPNTTGLPASHECVCEPLR